MQEAMQQAAVHGLRDELSAQQQLLARRCTQLECSLGSLSHSLAASVVSPGLQASTGSTSCLSRGVSATTPRSAAQRRSVSPRGGSNAETAGVDLRCRPPHQGTSAQHPQCLEAVSTWQLPTGSPAVAAASVPPWQPCHADSFGRSSWSAPGEYIPDGDLVAEIGFPSGIEDLRIGLQGCQQASRGCPSSSSPSRCRPMALSGRWQAPTTPSVSPGGRATRRTQVALDEFLPGPQH